MLTVVQSVVLERKLRVDSLTVAGIANAISDASAVEDGAAGERIARRVGVSALAVTRARRRGQGGSTQQWWRHAQSTGAETIQAITRSLANGSGVSDGCGSGGGGGRRP